MAGFTPPLGQTASQVFLFTTLPASDPSGIAEFRMEYSANGSSWTNLGNISTSGGSLNHAPSTANRAAYTYAWYRTYLRDNLGNDRYTTAQAFVQKPYGTYYMDPSSTSLNVGWGTWSTGYGGWRTGISHVYSGWISSASAYQYGYVFYGSNQLGGNSGDSRGFTPDSATVSVSKSSSSGCGGVLTFATHNYSSRPTTPNLSTPNTFSSGTINFGGHETVSFSSGARAAIGDNSGFGLLIYPNNNNQITSCGGGSTYRQTSPPGNTTYDTDPWRIYAYYTV